MRLPYYSAIQKVSGMHKRGYIPYSMQTILHGEDSRQSEESSLVGQLVQPYAE